MLKRVLFIVFISFFIVLQSTLINLFSIDGIIPDIAMILLIFFSVLYGKRTGLVLGFTSGLIKDFLSQSPPGFHAFISMVIGFIAGFLKFHIDTGSILFQVISSIVATILKYVLAIILLSLFSITSASVSILSRVFFIELALNTVLAPVVFYIANVLKRKFSRIKGGF